jgi:hypothetical protein
MKGILKSKFVSHNYSKEHCALEWIIALDFRFGAACLHFFV